MVKGFVGKIAKAVLEIIMPDVTEQLLRVFKLDKLVNYMELPNEADKGVEKLKEEIAMLKESLKSIEKDTHPPAIDLKEWAEVKELMKKFKKIRSL